MNSNASDKGEWYDAKHPNVSGILEYFGKHKSYLVHMVDMG